MTAMASTRPGVPSSLPHAVKTRLPDEKRAAEGAVHDGAAREELAEQGAESDSGADHRGRHPDPGCDIERQQTEREERDHGPGHVVEDHRVVALRVERDAR